MFGGQLWSTSGPSPAIIRVRVFSLLPAPLAAYSTVMLGCSCLKTGSIVLTSSS